MRERTVVSFWEPVFVLSLDQAVNTSACCSADFSHLPPKTLRWNHDVIQMNFNIIKDFDSETFVCIVWPRDQDSGRVESSRGWIIGATALQGMEQISECNAILCGLLHGPVDVTSYDSWPTSRHYYLLGSPTTSDFHFLRWRIGDL